MEPDKRKPENNPWYLLATLHGEASSADNEVHARNRTAWNRFMAAELTEDARALLIKEGRGSAEDLKPFAAEDLADVEKLFAERHRQAGGEVSTGGASPPLPNLKQKRIEFSNVKFDRPFLVKGFVFPHLTNFWNATFSSWPDFSDATFSAHAGFSGATFRRADFSRAAFSSHADFSSATFSDPTHFWGTRFCRGAAFSGATFSGWTGFLGATFSGSADFRVKTFSDGVGFSGATFSGSADFSNAIFPVHADFSSVTFEKGASFVNAEMKGPTSFENAKFSTAPPQFLGAKLHQGTVWRGVPRWPLPGKHEEAGSFVDAYACLKLEMDRLKKHEDELDFFVLELQSRRVLDGDREQQVSELKVLGWTVFLVPSLKTIFEKIKTKIKTLRLRKLFGRFSEQPLFAIQARTIRVPRSVHGLAIALYGGLSDYGRSYVRPLTGLLITAAIGVLPFWWHLCKFWQALGISFANTLGVLGFRRDLIDPKDIADLPGLLKVLASAQTVAGIVLLFLLGLAIRNRFRMK